MNFIKGIFGKSTTDNKINKIAWKPLIDEHQLDSILKESKLKPIILFKHSTRCGTSIMVKNRLDKILESQLIYELYFLDLLKYRNLSNLIADKFEVYHQSPQLIIIYNEKVVASASHYNILNVNFKK